MENYNGWNIPFAKTVEIVGRKKDDSYDGKYGIGLPADSYKLEVDPSAVFSFIFIPEDSFTDPIGDDRVSMNYTFLGNEVMLAFDGVWVDVNMTIPTDVYNDTLANYTVSLTIFCALTNSTHQPPDAGLNGTLGVAVTPNNLYWKEISVLTQLEEEHAFPKIYVSYSFY